MRPFCLLSVGLFVVPLVVAAPLPIGDKLPAVAAPVPAQGSPPPDANLVPVLAPIPEDVAAVSPGTAQEATSEISKETPAEAAGAYPPRVPETYTPEQQKRLAFTQRFQNQIIHGKILATRGPGNRMLVYTRLFLFKAEGHQNIEGLEKELRAFFRTDVTVTLDQEGKVHARKTQTGENIDLLYDNKDIAAGPGEQMLYVLMFSREIDSMSAEEKATIDKGMHISPDALKEGKFVLGSFDEGKLSEQEWKPFNDFLRQQVSSMMGQEPHDMAEIYERFDIVHPKNIPSLLPGEQEAV